MRDGHINDDSQTDSRASERFEVAGNRIIAICGYLLIAGSVGLFGIIGYIQIQRELTGRLMPFADSWLEFLQEQSATIALFLIAVVMAIFGLRLLTSARLSYTRTIPHDDLLLVKDAVIAGKSEPIDQYVRLRSLSGFAGNFTMIGITGLPLTTVILTLIFSAIALAPTAQADAFLDLAKLTLGAFIGSFVQRSVEQRKLEAGGQARTSSNLPA